VSDDHLGSFMLTLFNELANDDQDSVRLLTVEILVAIAKRFDEQKNRETLLEPLKSLARDKAWRVRYMVSSKFVEVSFKQLNWVLIAARIQFLIYRGLGLRCYW